MPINIPVWVREVSSTLAIPKSTTFTVLVLADHDVSGFDVADEQSLVYVHNRRPDKLAWHKRSFKVMGSAE